MKQPLPVNLPRLLKLRLVVARIGEMDNARWWNTNGQLGPLGALALKRGLPRSHHFAQARSVFAVAAHRCAEVFDPPLSMTLWKLPPEVEDEFDAQWEHWLDAASWRPTFEQIEKLQGTDLLAALQTMDLVGAKELEAYTRLKRSAEGRAVQLPGTHKPDDATLTMLAVGFARGEPGAPAIPYARLDD